MTINYKKKCFKNASFVPGNQIQNYLIILYVPLLLLLNNLLFVLENQVQNYLIILCASYYFS